MWLIRKIGSLYFTAVICITLMVLLIVSTSLESIHGTPFVQKTFYQTKWFDALLSLLWLNIFSATILRFPFKKHHVGFLITHIGILGLLLGALLTRLLSVEGQMALFEGETSHQMKVGGYQLSVTYPDSKVQLIDLGRVKGRLPVAQFEEKDLNISIAQVLERAVEETVVKNGKDTDPKRFALKVNLLSRTMKADDSFWVVEGDGRDPHGGAMFIGPLKASIRPKGEAAGEKKAPTLVLLNKTGKELARVNLTAPVEERMPLKGSALTLSGVRYYPYARVGKGNKLMNDSQGSANPAVEFDISDARGNKEHFVKFALYPDFESMHQKSDANSFDVTAKLDVPQEEIESYGGPSLTFLFTKDGKWFYEATLHNSLTKEGELKLNAPTELGWMDMSFRVDQLLDRALVSQELVNSSNPKEGVFALEVSAQDNAGHQSRWMVEGQKVGLRAPKGDIVFELTAAQKELPFALTLKDFRKKDYPGTERPASFESDVSLADLKESLRLERTISMNKPLDYKGYRIFQSSFMQDQNSGEASIFTVAKNPGIAFIYISSCILFTGAFLQFYVKQFSRKPQENGRKDHHGA